MQLCWSIGGRVGTFIGNSWMEIRLCWWLWVWVKGSLYACIGLGGRWGRRGLCRLPCRLWSGVMGRAGCCCTCRGSRSCSGGWVSIGRRLWRDWMQLGRGVLFRRRIELVFGFVFVFDLLPTLVLMLVFGLKADIFIFVPSAS